MISSKKMSNEDNQEKRIPDFLFDERKKVFFELPFAKSRTRLYATNL